MNDIAQLEGRKTPQLTRGAHIEWSVSLVIADKNWASSGICVGCA